MIRLTCRRSPGRFRASWYAIVENRKRPWSHPFFPLERKNSPQSSDRIQIDCTEILQLPGGSLSFQHQQVRKARRQKMTNFRYGSSLKWFVERPCGYQGDNLAMGSVPQNHESLQEKLLVSGFEVLYWAIDNDTLLSGTEIVHTIFWILIVINMKVALCWVECTPIDDNIWIWGVSHLVTCNV